MKKIIIVTITLVGLLSFKLKAAQINPDGYCWHHSITVYPTWSYAEEFRERPVYNFTLKEYVQKEVKEVINSCDGSIRVELPVSRNTTLIANASLNGRIGGTATGTVCIGSNYFTSKVYKFEELMNPDGDNNSFVFSPLLGMKISSQIIGYYASQVEYLYGMTTGMKMSYITTDHVTVQSSCVYNRLRRYRDFCAKAGVRVHFNNVLSPDSIRDFNPDGRRGSIRNSNLGGKKESIWGFNPDGRKGSFTVSPNLGYYVSSGWDKGYIANIEIIMPVSHKKSINCSVQYTRQEKENYIDRAGDPINNSKCNQYSFGLGLTLHNLNDIVKK